MSLTLDINELKKAFDTEVFRAERFKQYSEITESELGLKVVKDDYLLNNDEIADLHMSGYDMWLFIETTIHATIQHQASKSIFDNPDIFPEKKAHNILANLALLPEGPFFYAVRAIYARTYINERSRHGFAHHVRELVSSDKKQLSDGLMQAQARLQTLGSVLNSVMAGKPNASQAKYDGSNVVDNVGLVLMHGKLDWFEAHAPKHSSSLNY